jgi:hypothetical protein
MADQMKPSTLRTLNAANRTAARLADQLRRARETEGRDTPWGDALLSLVAHHAALEVALVDLTSDDPTPVEGWREWPS